MLLACPVEEAPQLASGPTELMLFTNQNRGVFICTVKPLFWNQKKGAASGPF